MCPTSPSRDGPEVPIGDSLESTTRLSVRHAEQEGRPLAYIVVRVNRFESFKQRHGDQAADQALTLLEAYLASSIRSSDACYSLGAGELLLIAQETTHSGAWLFAARVLRALQAAQPQGEEMPATFSLGVADYIHGDDSDSLIARARQRADGAEAAGDDRVFAHPPEEVDGEA